MYLLFFIIWIILNGKVTLEITILGILIAAAMYAFICKFMDYNPKLDLIFVSEAGYVIKYILVLIWEIIKANIEVLKIVFSSKYDFEPAVIKFKTNLKTNTAKVVLANSITLTPGTITVLLEGNEYTIHCLDKDFGKGIEDSVFVKMLEKMEARIERSSK